MTRIFSAGATRLDVSGWGDMRPFLAGSLLLVACASAPSEATDTDEGSSGGPSGDSTSTASETASSGGEGESTSAADTTTGGEPPDEADHVAGSRLTPVLQGDTEGLERFAYWHDPELGSDCAFAETAEGFACLPLYSWGSNTFADSGCSQPALVDNGCGDVPEYGRFYDQLCGVQSLARRGEALETVYLRDSNDDCVEWTGGPGFRIEAVPTTMAVQATRSLRPVDATLGRWEYAADDGSAQWSGPVLVDEERVCSVESSDGEAVCLAGPVPYVASYLHRDAACSSGGVLIVWPDEGCDVPRFARDRHDALWTVTGQLDLDAVWNGDDADSCTSLADQGPSYDVYGVRAFESGEAPEIGLEMLGAGRLRQRVPQTPGGERLSGPDYRWEDTALGFPCAYADDDHGEARCVPQAYASASYFSDPGCSTPLLRGPDERIGEWRTVYAYETCDRRLLGAGQVEASYPGDVYRPNGEGVCEALADPSSYGPFFSIDLQPPSALAPMELLR